MARQRTLHPDFFTDERVVSVSFAARLLFQGLWCEADREGRLECKPLTLKMRLFPADAVDVNELLGELMDAGLIESYEVDGRPYLLVPKLGKRQRFHPRELPSRHPAPPKPLQQDLGTPRPEPGATKPELGVPRPERILASPSGSSGSSLPSGSSDDAGSSAEAHPHPRFETPAGAFFARSQELRLEHGYATEKPPRALSAWFSRALMELNGDEPRLWATYAAFTDDDHWATKKPPWPFEAFISTWRNHVPKQEPKKHDTG